jgi:hypothetical protein
MGWDGAAVNLLHAEPSARTCTATGNTLTHARAPRALPSCTHATQAGRCVAHGPALQWPRQLSSWPRMCCAVQVDQGLNPSVTLGGRKLGLSGGIYNRATASYTK